MARRAFRLCKLLVQVKVKLWLIFAPFDDSWVHDL